jgi:hypothetical protein
MITHARFYILFSLGCDDFLWINSSAKKTQNGSRQTYTAAIPFHSLTIQTDIQHTYAMHAEGERGSKDSSTKNISLAESIGIVSTTGQVAREGITGSSSTQEQVHSSQQTQKRSNNNDLSRNWANSNTMLIDERQTMENSPFISQESIIESSSLIAHSYATASHEPQNNATSKINITKEDMQKYFKCPQGLAARLLGVSVSKYTFIR